MTSFLPISNGGKNTIVLLLSIVFLIVPILLNNYLLLAVLFIGAIGITYLFINNLILNIRELLIVIIGLSIILPGIQLTPSFPEIRPEEFIIYAIFPFIFLYNISKSQLNEYSKKYAKYYILFLTLAVISTIYGIVVLNVNSGTRDIVEFVKMGKYLLIFLTVATSKPTERDLKILLNTFLVVMIVSATIGILQFYNIFGFSSLTGPIYLDEKIYKVNERLTGTFTNPNSYSVVLGFSIIISLVMLLKERSFNQKLFYIFTLGFFSICLLITGSRTGLVATIFCLIILLLLYLRFNIKNVKSLVPIIVLLGVSFTIGVYYAGQDIVTRLSSGINLLENESLLMRVYAWYLNIQLIIQSPILGWGPAKEMFTTVVDNEYILIVRRYGIVGSLPFFTLYLYPLLISIKHYFRSKGDRFALIFSVTIIFFMISNLTNSVYNHIQTMDMWFIILGTYFGIQWYNIKPQMA